MDEFVIVDVGARWGVADRWASLAPDVRVFGFDPDVEECERLNREARETGDEISRYVPVALGPTDTESILYATVEPACSSLYPPRAELAATFDELRCIGLVGQDTVGLRTLDDWCTSNGVDHVDVIKLDTQGAELGVLEGATSILRTVQMMEIEVEFNPLYEGQPLFGDVDAFARRHGFVLWRLDHLVHYSNGPFGATPMEARAFYDSIPHISAARGGQLYWGHAYFVRAELCPAAVRPADDTQRQRSGRLAEAAGLTDLAAYLLG